MSVVWKILKHDPKPPDIVYALIDILKGSNIKYEVDHNMNILFTPEKKMVN